MIRDGMFEKFPMEAVFGAHNWPGMPVGMVGVNPGAMMASSNGFRAVVRGKGSHAALPHLGVDPVMVACQMVMAWQTILTRNKKPIDPGVISATMIHTGEAINVVPDSAEIRGTVRTFSIEVLDLIETRMREIATGLAATFGATCEFEFTRVYPPTVNHAAETEFVRRTLAQVVGEANVVPFEPTMGAEDFSFFLQEKPGCYFTFGNGDGTHREGGHGLGPCMLHNPSYDFNDELIPVGASCWVRLAEAWLEPR
jgi:hippurate hydrolase